VSECFVVKWELEEYNFAFGDGVRHLQLPMQMSEFEVVSLCSSVGA